LTALHNKYVTSCFWKACK